MLRALAKISGSAGTPARIASVAVVIVGFLGAPIRSDAARSGELTPDQWRDDVDFAVSHLTRWHANAFHTIDRVELTHRADRLKARATAASAHEMVVGLSRLVASIGDAHTYLEIPREGPLAFREFPVRYEWFGEGLFVVEATEEHGELVGTRVVAFDETAWEEALSRASEVLYRENAATARFSAPLALQFGEIVHALGITRDAARFQLTVEDAKTGRRTARLVARAVGGEGPPLTVDVRDEIRGVPPIYLRHRDRVFWVEYLPDDDALYVLFNECRDAEDETIAELAARIGVSFQEHPAGTVILDVRANIGGDSRATLPLVRALAAYREANPEATFFVIIGRFTLSATIVMLAELEKYVSPVLVGEPTGARPNPYGENPFTVQLPHSGLEMRWATQYFQAAGPDPHGAWIAPDLAAEPAFLDLVSGRDPALEAIRSYRPVDLAGTLRTSYEAGGIAAAEITYEKFRSDARNRYVDTFRTVRRFGNELLEERQRPHDALRAFRWNERDYPDRARTYIRLGAANEVLGKTDEARALYERSLRLLPSDASVSAPLRYALERWVQEALGNLPARP